VSPPLLPLLAFADYSVCAASVTRPRSAGRGEGDEEVTVCTAFPLLDVECQVTSAAFCVRMLG
jgi:hypothetical protein